MLLGRTGERGSPMPNGTTFGTLPFLLPNSPFPSFVFVRLQFRGLRCALYLATTRCPLSGSEAPVRFPASCFRGDHQYPSLHVFRFCSIFSFKSRMIRDPRCVG